MPERKSSKNKICKAKIMELADLPEPSAMLGRVLPMLSEENVQLELLAREIGRDQALVARMLKLVNSSYYHLKCKVDTVRAAVGLLGLSTIKRTVYSAICYNCFSSGERLLWSHAYTCSLLTDRLAKEEPGQKEGCLQLTALLHDLGKIVLLRNFSRRYKDLLRNAAKTGTLEPEAEREAFGADHGEIGSWLLEAWEMRPDIVAPIAAHHKEEPPAGLERETAILKLADWLDNKAREIERPTPSRAVFKIAGISECRAKAILSEHREAIAAVEADF